MGFSPENVGSLSSLPQNDLEVFLASPWAQLQEITVSAFSIQLGYNPRSDRKTFFFKSDRRYINRILTYHSWIEKVLTVISCNLVP